MELLNENNLHTYQWTAHDHIIENTHCALFLDMGLGKTVSSLTAVKTLMYKELEITKTLVIAPKRVAENVWTSETKKWAHLIGLKCTRIIGTKKQRLIALKEESDVYLIGRDNVAWLCGEYGNHRLPFDMLIIDESSSFKNPKSIRFKCLRRVRESFKRIVLLTGTPAPNGLIDLWSQIFLLDGGKRLGKFISKYRDEYFKPDKRNGAIIYSYKLIKSGEERIFDQISDICMSMKAKDYLSLPKRINNYIEIPLGDKIKKKYDDFEAEQVLQLFEDTNYEKDISAANAAALSNKLLQFANGAIYDENKDWHTVHDCKIEELKNILEQSGGKPVLVAWTYRHDMYRMVEEFKKYNPRQLKNDKDINDWNEGKIQLMLMHPASGGHGLNLQSGGNIIVWFGQTWSLELYQQFNARLDRQGQTESVIVHHLIAKDTIDDRVIKSLDRKDGKQQGLMAAVKAIIKKHV